MPLTASGKSVLKSMEGTYGKKKGEQVFYASINKGKAGSHKWHLRKKAVKNILTKLK